VTTCDALEPVVLEGTAEHVTDRADIVRFTAVLHAKYAAEWVDELYTVDFFDGNLGGGGTYRITPTSVFALRASEFTTSPTRWRF
jgi:hypothetical protein